MTVLGPKNKVLGEDFLRKVLELLSNVDFVQADGPSFKNWSVNRFDNENEEFYKNFYATEPKISHEGDELYITKIWLTKGSDWQSRGSSYKAIWQKCDEQKPIPYRCDCEDSCSTSSVSEDDSEFTLLPLSFIKTVDVTYKGEFHSGPTGTKYHAGGQCDWKFGFFYKQDDFELRLEMGPRRRINAKWLSGWRVSSGSPASYPIIKEEVDKLVFDYQPNNLYFEDDFYDILRDKLISCESLIDYKGWLYELLDWKFCDVDSYVRGCGCCPSFCNKRSKAWGVSQIPSKQTSSYNSFNFSCTPEWYLQLQVGSCNSSGCCARFILDPICGPPDSTSS